MAGFPQLQSSLDAAGVDYHIGVTSTSTTNQTARGCSPFGEVYLDGQLAQTGGTRWIDPTTPDPDTVFGKLALLGQDGSACEMPRLTTKQALLDQANGANKGFRRDTAAIHTVVVTNEDDRTSNDDLTPGQFISFYQSLDTAGVGYGYHAVSCMQVAGSCPFVTQDHIDMAASLAGVALDIDQLGQTATIDAIAEAVTPRGSAVYVLEDAPLTDTLEVAIHRVGGTIDDLELDNDYSFDETSLTVTLLTSFPEPGDEVVLSYDRTIDTGG